MATIGPFGFRGGWNAKASAWTLPKDSLTDSQNINIVWADIEKRNGCVKLQSSPSTFDSGAAIHGVFDWLAAAGTRYFLVTAGTKIYQASTLSGTYTDITGAVTVTAGQNNQHTFASLNNIVAICGGTTPDTPVQWTGSGNCAVLAGSPPAGNLVCVANNIMFLSGIAATPSRVFWSNVSDPNTWPASSYIDFRASDGDTVTCIIELNQNLVIFKRRSIGLLGTQTTSVAGVVTLAPLSEVIVGMGCPGSQCVDHMPDGRLVFLGTNAHVYILQSAQTLIDISDPSVGSNIQPILDALNFSRLPYAVVRCYPTRNQIWISCSSATSTTNDTVLVYDYQLGVWVSSFTNINANVMAAVIDPRTAPDHPILLVTGDYSGNIYEQDKGTTDATVSGGTIDSYGTISIHHGIDQTDFIPRCAVVPIESQSTGYIQVGYGFNGLTEVSKSLSVSELAGGSTLDVNFVLDTSLLSGTSTLRRIIPILSEGREYTTQLQFRNSAASQSFTVHPIYLSDEVLI